MILKCIRVSGSHLLNNMQQLRSPILYFFFACQLLYGCKASEIVSPQAEQMHVRIFPAVFPKIEAAQDSVLSFRCIVEPAGNRHILYTWDFGDDSYSLQRIDADSINYYYRLPGFYTIRVTAKDLETGKIIGEDGGGIQVFTDSNTLAPVSKPFGYGVNISFTAEKNYDTAGGPLRILYERNTISYSTDWTIHWIGRIFKTSISTTSVDMQYPSPTQKTTTYVVYGKISRDSSSIDTLYIYQSLTEGGYSYQNQFPNHNSGSQLTAVRIPQSISTKNNVVFRISGDSLQKHILSFSDWDYTAYGYTQSGNYKSSYSYRYVSTIWDSKTTIPDLKITINR